MASLLGRSRSVTIIFGIYTNSWPRSERPSTFPFPPKATKSDGQVSGTCTMCISAPLRYLSRLIISFKSSTICFNFLADDADEAGKAEQKAEEKCLTEVSTEAGLPGVVRCHSREEATARGIPVQFAQHLTVPKPPGYGKCLINLRWISYVPLKLLSD